MATDEALARENDAVLATVQALVGRVPAELWGVALTADSSVLRVYFGVGIDDDDVRAQIADIVGEIEGDLWQDDVTVEVEMYVGAPHAAWVGLGVRLVFLSKTAADAL